MSIRYKPAGDHIVLITIDRPEAHNSLDLDHFKWLREAWERFEAEADAWVAVVTGVGPAFCSGADLKRYVPEITKLGKQLAEQGLTEIGGYRLDDGTRAVLRDWTLAKPIVAAVNGSCTAGGMEMLGGTDVRVACPEARFAVMEPKRGLFAGGGTTVRLPRQIPWAAAMELLLCADLVDASRARELGLLNAVVPREELLDAAMGYARRIVANAPLAIQATKRSALEGLYADDAAIKAVRAAVKALAQALELVTPDDPVAARSAVAEVREQLAGLAGQLRPPFANESALGRQVFATEDAKEGPRAFAERREPKWTARLWH